VGAGPAVREERVLLAHFDLFKWLADPGYDVIYQAYPSIIIKTTSTKSLSPVNLFFGFDLAHALNFVPFMHCDTKRFYFCIVLVYCGLQ
jgi:hypothetical protein